MAPFPLPLAEIMGHWGQYIIYLVIGIAFGFALEMSGFANAPLLAAQFYFKNMTVLKVMFGAIVTAMVLVFLSAAVGLLDYNLVYVNETYLWPGIIGGLIMGMGFIIGGYCPGTSVVGAAVGKIDGILFVLGVLFGIFAFGETVGFYEAFWHSSYLGRFTIPEWLGLPYGVVVVLIVLMALFMFWGAEQLEKIFGGRDLSKEPKWRIYAGGGLLGLALLTAFIGQPTTEQKWSRIEATETARLTNREVQIHPAELALTMTDDTLRTIILDVRPEADYNLFHLQEAQHAPLEALPDMLEELRAAPENSVVVVVGNDEAAATEAWKFLRAESVRSAYILEGGLNNWLRTFGDEAFVTDNALVATADDRPAFAFPAALGAKYPFAAPNETLARSFTFTPKIVLEVKRGPGGGGCG
ncbi:MAG: YeeE/YedE family protein [Anaerolineales bacterium]|uniref:YeeE/YedE thiosulfate transporter family protein n=1 Tax=Promineifilum sp. TaxID=2664178 RepID=UPI001D78327E|nr:YeeE/YedE family protein [Anaerolineales bacterium]MCO5181235.1 YeeE/YedE family protein [Promineifilum sp.]